MGKTYTAKTPPDNFKATTLKNLLLSKQAVTSKGILIPYTNLQLNHYPNIQLDLFCNDNLSFQQYVTNQITNQLHGSQYVTSITNQRRLLVAQFFSSSHDEDQEVVWSQNPTMYKTQQFLHKKNELGQILSPVTICLNKTLLNICAACVTFNGL